MPNLLLVIGHAAEESYTHALARAYEAEARDRGASVTRIDLATLSFDPVLRGGYSHVQPLEPDLVRARDALVAAEHVVFFFPTWWAAPPAIVKAFVDRVFLPGFAFRYVEGKALPERLLRGRSARVVTTMDSPRLWYRFVQRRSVHAAFVTGTLWFSGFGPIDETTIHRMRELTADERAGFLERVARQAADDVRRLSRTRAPKPLLSETSPR